VIGQAGEPRLSQDVADRARRARVTGQTRHVTIGRDAAYWNPSHYQVDSPPKDLGFVH
jgi:hypothetical protein